MRVEQIVEELTAKIDEAIAGLPLDDAVAVVEGVQAHVDAAMAGLEGDLADRQAAEGEDES